MFCLLTMGLDDMEVEKVANDRSIDGSLPLVKGSTNSRWVKIRAPFCPLTQKRSGYL